jgi:hypothetical protein
LTLKDIVNRWQFINQDSEEKRRLKMKSRLFLMASSVILLLCTFALLAAWPGAAWTQAPGEEDSVVHLPIVFASGNAFADSGVVVDTGESKCYDTSREIPCPQEGEAFYGQDAQYAGAQPSYTDNGDGTVTDNVTGLMWQKTPGDKVTYAEAAAGADTFSLAGYDDWRLPTIKELYSLMDFSGHTGMSAATSEPYIDTDYFDFEYGDTSAGERFIDAQYWSSTEYVGTTMNGQATVFGVNFADGRIKGYGLRPDGSMAEFVRYVRGNTGYGVNNFVDNGDGTITDLATGLMWMKTDSGTTMNWEQALDYAENLEYAGYDDWRLPNAKELQSIVDYTRAPDATDPAQMGPAIDPIFDITSDDSFFWTSTTHVEGPAGDFAAYVAFGEAWGYMEQPPGSGNYVLMNVHGAGAQRSDPKSGDPGDYPYGHGPQGDVIRIYNYVRCVRGGAESVEVADSGIGEPAGQPSGGNQPTGGEQPPAGGSLPGGGGIQPPGQPPAGTPGQPGTPPQEAIDACSGLTQNAACEITTPQGTISGTCAAVQNQLACVPRGGPPAGPPQE